MLKVRPGRQLQGVRRVQHLIFGEAPGAPDVRHSEDAVALGKVVAGRLDDGADGFVTGMAGGRGPLVNPPPETHHVQVAATC